MRFLPADWVGHPTTWAMMASCVLLSVLLNAAAVAAQATECSSSGTAYGQGGELSNIPNAGYFEDPVKGPAQCQAQCQARGKLCVYWTWVRDDNPEKLRLGGGCWLASETATQTSMEGAVSGLKDCTLPTIAATTVDDASVTEPRRPDENGYHPTADPCCTEHTAKCMACQQNKSLEDYCAEPTSVARVGCDGPTDHSEYRIPSVAMLLGAAIFVAAVGLAVWFLVRGRPRQGGNGL
mmetsp:Transcript_70385/g.139617  ORF Transcript_70385/g.139617 Transcript_70385/m.139617 type:complete len:237 (-) Transcript_70385:283-993(-)|eukprot:CAMPEP_0172669552 /NCGR_PEP_ID=MMETSP1074-20121228/9751_1 /TAXON_ID=2916 /ORGANISM="Ceratium fusus, Strain PA161109" /LENGTH=236 /DNA_ID=CAMNT_0013486341 /DNA_START=18 /DNA_END=728 /DNA_ORIENTATION=-